MDGFPRGYTQERSGNRNFSGKTALWGQKAEADPETPAIGAGRSVSGLVSGAFQRVLARERENGAMTVWMVVSGSAYLPTKA